MINEDLTQGIEAARVGNMQQARAHLKRAVQTDPGSETGWLWLGHCLQDPKQREFCYQRVLALNPNNEAARKALSTLPSPRSARATPPVPTRSRSNQRLTFVALAGSLALVFCALSLAVISQTGGLKINLAQNLPLIVSITPAPSATATLSPSPMPSFTPRPVPASATANATLQAITKQAEAEKYAAEATSAMLQLNFTGAIALWDKAIALADQNHAYHAQRAACYSSQAIFQRDLETQRQGLNSALADLNQAIAMRPLPGYFAARYDVLVGLGDASDLSADARYFYNRAAEDMSVAISWGQAGDAKRKLAAAMIYGGQCTAGLPAVQMLRDEAGSDQGYLYQLEAVAYACLGRLDEAIQAVDLSIENGGDWRNAHHKAAYLYQAGKAQAALDVINQSIEQSPDFNGGRYFLRALIHYEMGQQDLMEQDLASGEGNTWARGELRAYVKGKIALAAGDQSSAIEALQLAEASLPVTHNSLRLRIQKELAELGAQPLAAELSPGVLALELTETPTPAPAGSSALSNNPDGSSRFVDYDGGFELSLPIGWLAFRPNAHEYYAVMEQEGARNEFLRKLMSVWQANDPKQYRLYAVFPESQEMDARDLASLDVQIFNEDVTVDQALVSSVQNLKNQHYNVTRSELVDSQRGMSAGVIEYEASGNSAVTGELLTFHYKIYLFKTDKGLAAISLTTIEALKDLLFPKLDQILETVNLLH